MAETKFFVQVIRAFKDKYGVTHIFNYKGHPKHTGPIGRLKRTVIDDHTVRWTDEKKASKNS